MGKSINPPQTVHSSCASFCDPKYCLFAVASLCLCFYLAYTSSLTWRKFTLDTNKTILDNNAISDEADSTNIHMYDGGESEKLACRLPTLDPFDSTVKKFIKSPAAADCQKDHPLVFTTDLESNLIQLMNISSLGYQYCCYQRFERKGGSDRQITLDKNCTRITDPKTRIPDDMDFVMVSCLTSKYGSENATWKVLDLFAFVHLKPDVEKRIDDFHIQKQTRESTSSYSTITLENQSKKPVPEARRTVNVVVLGLDAVSHMNFMRIMPLTYEYITKNLSAHGMFGYTKVGVNTFPNMVPALTGQTVEELTKTCWPKKSKPFDTCPFIWKNYSSEGYRTAYGEDAIWMGIFNYQKQGFKKQPTDYYNNAFTYQLEQKVGHHKLMNAKLCYGPRIGFQVSLDFIQKMAFRMNKTRRYFQFIWATSMTHDYVNEGKLGDKPLLETLQWFKHSGFFEDTVFVLMSDHGIGYGDIRSTLQGKVEARMPFLYFILPDWFRDRYRAASSNLIRNKHRLTSPFDLHETLLDLLKLENIENIRSRYGSLDSELPRGISLFLPIPTKRTCKDAGIDDQWCICRALKPVKLEGNSLVQEAAVNVVKYINRMFKDVPQCIALSLHQVLNAQVLHSSNDEVKDLSFNITSAKDKRLSKQEVTFTIAFEVLPSKGTFEATTTRRTDGVWQVSGEISRTNVYGDQSICVTDYDLKKFCFCG